MQEGIRPIIRNAEMLKRLAVPKSATENKSALCNFAHQHDGPGVWCTIIQSIFRRRINPTEVYMTVKSAGGKKGEDEERRHTPVQRPSVHASRSTS